MNLSKIGNRIRDIRKEKGISQADVAADLDISITAFSKIERGLTNLSINRLEQIANYLNVSIINLIDEEIKEINDKKNVSDNNKNISSSEKELAYTKELLKAKEEIIELLKNKLKVK